MKNSLHIAALSLAATTMLAAMTMASQAATVVNVSLWDKGVEMEMPTDLLYGTPGIDMSQATMGIKVSTNTAPHGVVSFKVTNDSKDTIHEMILIKLDTPGQPLPYDATAQRVDEEAAGDLGEVSELEPGQSGSLTRALQAGDYLLICNVTGHFAAGMWTEFTVTP